MTESQDNAAKTAILKLESLKMEYDNTLIQYNQAQADYTNTIALEKDSKATVLSDMKGKTYSGKTIISEDRNTNTLENCKTKCLAKSACTGATYNSDTKYCSLRGGESTIEDGSTNEYAIIPNKIKQLTILHGLSNKLMKINAKILALIQENKSLVSELSAEKQIQLNLLHQNSDRLSEQKETLNGNIKELEKLSGAKNESEIVVTRNYYSYIFLLAIAVFVGICTIALSYTNSSSTSVGVSDKNYDYNYDDERRPEREPERRPEREPEYEKKYDYDDDDDYEENQRGGKYLKQNYHYVFLFGLFLIVFYTIQQIVSKI